MPAAPSVTFDPDRPGIPPQDGSLKEFPSYLLFPSAGCYLLEATWATGTWRLGFGFGS